MLYKLYIDGSKLEGRFKDSEMERVFKGFQEIYREYGVKVVGAWNNADDPPGRPHGVNTPHRSWLTGPPFFSLIQWVRSYGIGLEVFLNEPPNSPSHGCARKCSVNTLRQFG